MIPVGRINDGDGAEKRMLVHLENQKPKKEMIAENAYEAQINDSDDSDDDSKEDMYETNQIPPTMRLQQNEDNIHGNRQVVDTKMKSVD